MIVITSSSYIVVYKIDSCKYECYSYLVAAMVIWFTVYVIVHDCVIEKMWWCLNWTSIFVYMGYWTKNQYYYYYVHFSVLCTISSTKKQQRVLTNLKTVAISNYILNLNIFDYCSVFWYVPANGWFCFEIKVVDMWCASLILYGLSHFTVVRFTIIVLAKKKKMKNNNYFLNIIYPDVINIQW